MPYLPGLGDPTNLIVVCGYKVVSTTPENPHCATLIGMFDYECDIQEGTVRPSKVLVNSQQRRLLPRQPTGLDALARYARPSHPSALLLETLRKLQIAGCMHGLGNRARASDAVVKPEPPHSSLPPTRKIRHTPHAADMHTRQTSLEVLLPLGRNEAPFGKPRLVLCIGSGRRRFPAVPHSTTHTRSAVQTHSSQILESCHRLTCTLTA